jgi:hypothetical protein
MFKTGTFFSKFNDNNSNADGMRFRSRIQIILTKMDPIIEGNTDRRTDKIKSISYRDGEFIIRELTHLDGDFQLENLPGVFCKGIQYYDLRNVGSINNTGMAGLIDLMKSLLQQGVETRFANANDDIRNRITSLGLGEILKCV